MIGVVGLSAHVLGLRKAHQWHESADRDLNALLDDLADSSPPPPAIGGAVPYQVSSNYSIVETGGPEAASTTLVNSGLIITLHVHTCRPRVMGSRERTGEINLVDGSGRDRATSGGVLSISDTETDESFDVFFKLIGAPTGGIGWNARQLVSPRTADATWRQTLAALHRNLPQPDQPALPETVRESNGRMETCDATDPMAVLMHGAPGEMMKLFTFRATFRRFYVEPDPQTAAPVVWLLLDTLLNSPGQQRLSRRWINYMRAAQAGADTVPSPEGGRNQPR